MGMIRRGAGRHPGGDRPVLGDGRGRRGRTLLRPDLRLAVASEAVARHPYLGDLRPRRRGGPDPNGHDLYVHTIGWLPQALEVRAWSPLPEPGVNLDLNQTLDAVSAHDERVTRWGPFVITPDIYERSPRVYRILPSGVVRYRALSTASNLRISDCIHAVAAVEPVFGRGHYPLIRIGDPAGRFLAREIVVRGVENRGIDQAAYDNSWLIPRLGLDRM